jgi:RHS repeat-associated protein
LALRIMEENHYYPFGLKHSGYNSDQLMYIKQGTTTKIVPIPPLYKTSYSYKYNGKELQEELGLNVYDMEARNYMPDIGRWGVIDELAESFFDISNYNFSNNNPIIFSDPSGMAPEGIASTFVNDKGKVIEHRDDGDDNVYLVNDDWKIGGSKDGLPGLGKESKDETYVPGFTYQFDEKGELRFAGAKQKIATGAATPMGGAYDIFGVWEAFWSTLFEESGADENPGLILAATIITKGKIKPKVSARVVSNLLKVSNKIHKHHVLSQQFRKWFASRGINNIDDYTVQMSARNHLKTVHGQGKWNSQWAQFIESNPNASPSQIFYQAETMLKSFGLEHSRYVPFR